MRVLNRYDVEHIEKALFESCVTTVFSEPQTDDVYFEQPDHDGVVFAVEYLPGQFDQRADSAAQCVQMIAQCERPTVRSARVYLLQGTMTDAEVETIKHHVINPVESREAALELPATLDMEYTIPEVVLKDVLQGSYKHKNRILSN